MKKDQLESPVVKQLLGFQEERNDKKNIKVEQLWLSSTRGTINGLISEKKGSQGWG